MSKKNKKLNPYIKNRQNKGLLNTNFGFTGGDFVVGALIGAAVTYVLTNKEASAVVMKTLA
ncbi:MAG: YtxH domain-containing protein, partial [Campylobacteraceae bacterium]|nr:YtxH domain-containing protein [Campylobacteraceae bacterium]